MRLLNFIVIRLSLFFVLGTLLGFYFEIKIYHQLIGLAFSLSLLLVYYLIQRKSFHPPYTFSALVYVVILQLGCVNASYHLPKNQENHFIHQTKNNHQTFLFKVTEAQKDNDFNYKYLADIYQINQHKSLGKCLVHYQKDSLRHHLEVGGVYQAIGKFQDFKTPKNPTDFNYKKFMERRGIKKQVYLKSENTVQLGVKQKRNLTAWAHYKRQEIKDSLAQNGFLKKESGLIQALVLGQKKDIDATTYQNFSKAGVVHILAVSGLHVGIVLLLLQYIFKPLDWLPYGKILKTILILACLWLFGLMAGFSPSVTRAVTMFSLFAVAINMKRKTNTINVLCISLLILLLIQPNRIFEVGFQLSYSAVFAIVTMQPPLFKLVQPKWKPLKYLWSVASVTLTAQLGVLPLSLFYFKQFPGLFMLANIVIIPLLGIILGLGILVVILSLAGFLPEFLQAFFAQVLNFLSFFVNQIANQEEFVIQNINFSEWMFISLSIAIFFLLLSFRKPNFGNLAPMLLGLSSFFVAALVEQSKTNQTHQFIVFDQARKTIIGSQFAGHLDLFYSAENTNEIATNYAVKNYEKLEGLKTISFNKKQNIYALANEEFLLVVDEKEIYQLPELKNSIVLLTNSPKINLNRLIEILEPSLIIADANNYRSFIELWRTTAVKNKIDFHYTYEDGAWLKEWKQ